MLLASLMQCSKVDAITMSNQAAAETIAATHIYVRRMKTGGVQKQREEGEASAKPALPKPHDG